MTRSENPVRWRIAGRLTTSTPLHVGSGHTRSVRVASGRNTSDVEVSLMPLDAESLRLLRACDDKIIKDDQFCKRCRPYIPGSTLKGILRAWLELNAPEADVEAIFGTRSQSEAGLGGKVEFCNAYLVTDPSPDPATFVDVGVAIERRTRTADENKLFHRLAVRAGVAFQVELTGDRLTPEEAGLLMWALRNFDESSANPIVIGAATASGWGRVQWSTDHESVETFDRHTLANWLRSADPSTEQLRASANSGECMKTINSEASRMSTHAASVLRMKLELRFDSAFLVNDPRETAKLEREAGQQAPVADHYPRLTPDNRALLPGRSIRGVLRSQAERISRTLNRKYNGSPFDEVANKSAADAAFDQQTLFANHPIATLFGATGWRTAIRCSDFLSSAAVTPRDERESKNADGRPRLRRQEFVGIDRFHGGSSQSIKFNADVIDHAVLTGDVELRWNRPGVEPWCIGLLALVMRDLIEGDLRFGFGASKGFGRVRARILEANGDLRQANSEIRAWASQHQIESVRWDARADDAKADGALRRAMNDAVDTFRDRMKSIEMETV